MTGIDIDSNAFRRVTNLFGSTVRDALIQNDLTEDQIQRIFQSIAMKMEAQDFYRELERAAKY